jgi:hypothetical protein
MRSTVAEVGDGSYVVEFFPTAAEVSRPGHLTLRFGAVPVTFALPPLETVRDQWQQKVEAPISAQPAHERLPAKEDR